MPEAIVLAGPNGAGKSTSYFTLAIGVEFVSADIIALDLLSEGGRSQLSADVTASRLVLERLRELAQAATTSFCIEMSLASGGVPRQVRTWRAAGFRCHLWFISLPAPDLAVARVAQRVRAGGHDVPEAIVRRRWASGLRHLFDYAPLFDSWRIYDNSTEAGPELVASGEVDDFERWTTLRAMAGRA